MSPSSSTTISAANATVRRKDANANGLFDYAGSCEKNAPSAMQEQAGGATTR